MIARIKNRWLRRAVLLASLPIGVLLTFILIGAEGVWNELRPVVIRTWSAK